MKYEPRPAIHLEKQLGWAHKLGGAESLVISKAVQTVLARSMEPLIWHQLAGWGWGGGFRKGTVASVHLDVRCYSFSQYATGTSQAATPVLEFRGSASEVSPCVG